MVKNAFDDGVEEGNLMAWALDDMPLVSVEILAEWDNTMRTHRGVSGADYAILLAENVRESDFTLDAIVDDFNNGPRDLPIDVLLYDSLLEYVT